MNLACITGGSRGLGKALVDHYRSQGWRVIELSRSGSGGDHLDADLADLDRSLPAIDRKFAELAKENWTRVVFINNAGLLSPVTPVRKLADGDIGRNLAVNVTGAIRVIALFARHFHASSAAKIVANVSSGAALKGFFGWSLYCASKAAMENFIRTLAEEQAGADCPWICINIGPGVVDTAMQAEIRGVSKDDFPDVARFIEFKESGQLRQPDAVARTVFRIVAENPKNGTRYNVADFD